jgi:hypothetical protein
MDLSDPEELRAVVETIAVRSAGRLRLALTSDAIDALINPGLAWAPQELANIDEDKLREAIDSVIQGVVPLGGPGIPGVVATADEIREALQTSPCHYLWFC